MQREIFHVSSVRERNYFRWRSWTAEMKEEVRHRSVKTEPTMTFVHYRLG